MISVPKDTPRDGDPRHRHDGRRVVNDVFFDGCEVPAENLVGVEGQAWMQLMAGLNVERLIIAAQSLGPRAPRVRRHALLREGAQAVRPPDRQLPGLSQRLANMATEVECAKLLTYDVAQSVDANPGASSRAKRRWRSSRRPRSPSTSRSRACR